MNKYIITKNIIPLILTYGAALMWALPAPQSIWAIGLVRELSHVVGKYKLQRFSYQVSESEHIYKSRYESPK